MLIEVFLILGLLHVLKMRPLIFGDALGLASGHEIPWFHDTGALQRVQVCVLGQKDILVDKVLFLWSVFFSFVSKASLQSLERNLPEEAG